MSVGRNWFSAEYSRTIAFQEKETVSSVVHSGMPGTHSRPVTSGTWEDEAGSGCIRSAGCPALEELEKSCAPVRCVRKDKAPAGPAHRSSRILIGLLSARH